MPHQDADDQIRVAHDLLSCHNAVLGSALVRAVGEDVDAAGDLDKLQNPANSRDQGIVPLLEEDPRPLRLPLHKFPSLIRSSMIEFTKLARR
jgi:hypothetical protein